MSLNDPVNIHALRYATEATKVYLMEQYKLRYPHYFQFAHLETRPATAEDYYIPPSLPPEKCIVVVRTYFEEIGCKRFSCFPFRDSWETCTEQDPPQWIPLGEGFEMACQPSCRDHAVNADWTDDGRCVVSNPMKKTLASMPEKIYERASRHVYHGGLDVVDGKLKLNQKYCEAYGLSFYDDDCGRSGGQSFLEFLFGSTPILSARTASIPVFTAHPPPLPDYLNYVVPQPPATRTKRSALPQTADLLDEASSQKIYQEIATELVKEAGQEVAEYAIEKFLKKKAPKLLTVAVDLAATKLVIKQTIVAALKRFGSVALKALGKAFSVFTAIFLLYDLVVLVLDTLDVADFDKVLDKAALEKIDATLDFQYFKDALPRPELTPEFVWDYELLTMGVDETEKYQFMAACVEEYLAAVYAAQPSRHLFARLDLFVWKDDPRRQKGWNKVLGLCLIVVAVFFAFLYAEYIDVWANCLFFIKLYCDV